jgi:hypothetical protein
MKSKGWKGITGAQLKEGVLFGPRPKPLPKSGPSEESEHLRLVAALRRAGIYFVHVPMGGARGRRSGASSSRLGARKGFPDILVLDSPPPSWPRRCHIPGVALELKRPARGSRASPEQLAELRKLASRGWLATVQWGCDAALEYLREVGYEI